jgi:hypothetical protein
MSQSGRQWQPKDPPVVKADEAVPPRISSLMNQLLKMQQNSSHQPTQIPVHTAQQDSDQLPWQHHCGRIPLPNGG